MFVQPKCVFRRKNKTRKGGSVGCNENQGVLKCLTNLAFNKGSFTVPSASAISIEEVVIVIATNMLCCDISSTIVKDESQLTVTHLTRNDYQQQQMQYATYAW